MAEGSQVDTGRRWEARCNNLIDIENITWDERETRQPEPKASEAKQTCTTNHSEDILSLKDTKDSKYTDDAEHRTSSNNSPPKEANTIRTSQHGQDEHQEDRQEGEISDEETSTENSTAEKEEGSYEELICLVRQFYVERPVNPAAMAYQNIETC